MGIKADEPLSYCISYDLRLPEAAPKAPEGGLQCACDRGESVVDWAALHSAKLNYESMQFDDAVVCSKSCLRSDSARF